MLGPNSSMTQNTVNTLIPKKFKTQKVMSKPEIKPEKTEGEIKVERQQRVKSELSQLTKNTKPRIHKI